MSDTKKCPYCAEEIKIEAKKCRFCGEWFETTEAEPEDETSQPATSEAKQKNAEKEQSTISEKRSFLRWIPGFRSGQKWKMILGTLIYGFLLVRILQAFAEGDHIGLLVIGMIALSVAIFGVLVESPVKGEENSTLRQIPGFRSGQKWKKVVALIGYCFIFIFIFGIIFAVITGEVGFLEGVFMVLIMIATVALPVATIGGLIYLVLLQNSW